MFHTLMPPSLRLELSSAAKDAALDNRKAGAVCAVSKKKGVSDRASSPQTPAPATRVIETEIMRCCRIMYHLAADTRDLPAQCKRAQAPPATERCENGGKTRAACDKHQHAAVSGGSDDELEAGYGKSVNNDAINCKNYAQKSV